MSLLGLGVSAQEKYFSTQAQDLLPIDNESLVTEDVFFITDPSQFVFPVVGDVGQGFFFGFGRLFPRITTLQGPAREKVVLKASRISFDFPIVAYFGQRINNNNIIGAEVLGDIGGKGFGVDLGYTIIPESLPGVFSANIYNSIGVNPAFTGGESSNLPDGNEPWQQRIGGGLEYVQVITPKLATAVGINYQKVSIRNGVFSSSLEPVDEFGNKLTVSNSGQDDLLTVNLVFLYSNLNSLKIPTSGTVIHFGIDQSIPVGEANILFSRLNAQLTQYISPKLLDKNGRLDTLILDLQLGTIIGDVAPYEAYNLGGSESVRGYDQAGISSSSSFVKLSAEYRVPLLTFEAFKEDFDLRASIYFDYATDLGTASEVIGEPAVVRDKPGSGFGYGTGLNLHTSFGLFRLETALNNLGDFRLIFVPGDRY